MSHHMHASSPFAEPIANDWTIEALLEWFAADDARLSDPAVRALLRAIEETLTGSRWTLDLDASLAGARLTREPAIISLVRSVSLHVSRHPALRALTVADILRDGATTGPARDSIPLAEAAASPRS